MSTTVELVRANERYARLRAAVEGLLPDVCRITGCDIPCTRLIGAAVGNGTWAEEMCCRECRIRALLAAVDS